MSTEKYTKLNLQSRKMNEHNDCVVISIALVTGWSYKKAHKFCEERGRKKRHGANGRGILKSLTHHGFKVEKVYYRRESKALGKPLLTPAKLKDKFERGRYAVFIGGHMFAYINKEVHDWTSGGKHQIKTVYKITKIRK